MVETLAYANEAPWHRLGIQVDDTITPDKMLIKAGLNWSINKEPLMTMNTKQPVPEHYGLVRSSDNFVLGHCGKAYKPVQPKEVLTFFHDFVKSGSMKMEAAGSLDNGRHIFALASIQESFELIGSPKGKQKDKVDGYLLFSSPNVCGKAMNIMFTPVRVVCNNTLTMALHDASGSGNFRLHHSQTFNADEAKLAMGLAKGQLKEFQEEAQFLTSVKCSTDDMRQYFSEVWPTAKQKANANDNNDLGNIAEAAMSLVDSQPGADLFGGTWWNTFNAVTYMTDHVVGRSENNRLRRAWFGGGRNLKAKALTLAINNARKAA